MSNDWKDRNGKIIHELELIKIVNYPEIEDSFNWVVFDVIVCRNFTDYVLKNCLTNEIKILPQSCIERSY